jgi:hypothetical protein
MKVCWEIELYNYSNTNKKCGDHAKVNTKKLNDFLIKIIAKKIRDTFSNQFKNTTNH